MASSTPLLRNCIFAGYLLPRISHLGWLAPFVSASLFTLAHFWQPVQLSDHLSYPVAARVHRLLEAKYLHRHPYALCWKHHRRTPVSRIVFGICLTLSARAGLELLEDLELVRGQRLLTRSLVGLRQPIVRLRLVGLQPCRASAAPESLPCTAAVPRGVSRARGSPSRALGRARRLVGAASRPLHVRRRRIGGLPFPEAHRVVEVGERVSRPRLDETREALGDLRSPSSGATPYISPRNW